MKFEPRRTIRYYYLRIIRLRGDPHVLARGVAIGIFVGITPTIPFHTILAIALAIILRSSKIAALLFTVIVSNPFTLFFQYYFSWRLGTWLTFKDLSWEKIRAILDLITAHTGFREFVIALSSLGQDALLIMLVGGMTLALPFTLVGYLLAYLFFTGLQKNKKNTGSTEPDNFQNKF
jgi:uncharacterized protein (DUF2062 family)